MDCKVISVARLVIKARKTVHASTLYREIRK
jgi:hypothetical protein